MFSISRARGVWGKRFDSVPTEASERARQTRFLMARGFSSEVVRQVLSGRGVEEDGATCSDETDLD